MDLELLYQNSTNSDKFSINSFVGNLSIKKLGRIATIGSWIKL